MGNKRDTGYSTTEQPEQILLHQKMSARGDQARALWHGLRIRGSGSISQYVQYGGLFSRQQRIHRRAARRGLAQRLLRLGASLVERRARASSIDHPDRRHCVSYHKMLVLDRRPVPHARTSRAALPRRRCSPPARVCDPAAAYAVAAVARARRAPPRSSLAPQQPAHHGVDEDHARRHQREHEDQKTPPLRRAWSLAVRLGRLHEPKRLRPTE